VNEPPAITLGQAYETAEATAEQPRTTGDVVGVVQASDEDVGAAGVLSFHLVAGNEAG